MKKLIAVFAVVVNLLLPSMASAADDAKPKHPPCGATADECQKAVDSLNVTLQRSGKIVGVYQELLKEANDRLAQQAASH